MWYWVNLTFACGGIRTEEGIIKETPPIWKGWVGENIGDFYNYYQNKGTLIEIKAEE